MQLIKTRCAAALIFFASSFASFAQTPVAQDANPPAGGVLNYIDDEFNSVENKLTNLYDNGRLSMVLSGYAHHGRNTYTPERIHELNEKVWGFGVSKVLRDDKDNEEQLNFVVMADSHYNPQVMATYAYQWMKPLGGDWEAGIGYTAGLFSRPDILGGIPFPGLLPLATIGTRDTKLLISYVPRLSGNKGNGDVMFFALRINLK